jgi:rod shape-determining protein MreD
MNRFFLPFLVFVVFVSESLFVNFIAVQPLFRQWIISPRFVMIVLIFMTVYLNRKQAMLYGAIFGMLYDVAFTDILGVYMFGLPAICYVISQIMKVLQNNAIVVSFASVWGVAILEFYIYGINLLVHVTTMPLNEFLTLRLYPTLVLSIIFCILFSYLLKKRFQKLSLQYTDDRL